MEAETACTVGFGVEVKIKVLSLSVRAGATIYENLAGRGQGAVGGSFAVAELFNAGNGGLEQLSVLNAELAGQTHAALPVLFLRRVVVVRQTDPADEDGLVGISDIGGALGGIKVKAVVEMPVAGGRGEGQGVIIHLPDQIDIVIGAL